MKYNFVHKMCYIKNIQYFAILKIFSNFAKAETNQTLDNIYFTINSNMVNIQSKKILKY